MSFFESIWQHMSKWAAMQTVRNPLMYFAVCSAVVLYELHRTIGELASTREVGLIACAMLCLVMIVIVYTVGRLTERTPAHLYNEMELLRKTLNTERTVKDIALEVESKAEGPGSLIFKKGASTTGITQRVARENQSDLFEASSRERQER